jgi:hypothetical protein
LQDRHVSVHGVSDDRGLFDVEFGGIGRGQTAPLMGQQRGMPQCGLFRRLLIAAVAHAHVVGAGHHQADGRTTKGRSEAQVPPDRRGGRLPGTVPVPVPGARR